MSDSDMDCKEWFYILKNSLCTAVLTEKFFMDNHSHLEYLQGRAGKQAVVDTLEEGIGYYCFDMCFLLNVNSKPSPPSGRMNADIVPPW